MYSGAWWLMSKTESYIRAAHAQTWPENRINPDREQGHSISMENWQQSTDQYLRRNLDRFATVERVCGIDDGPIEKQADNYDKSGLKAVDLWALVGGMEVVKRSNTAKTLWKVVDKTAWDKFTNYVQGFIDSKPKPPKPIKVVPTVVSPPNKAKSVPPAPKKAAVPLPVAGSKEPPRKGKKRRFNWLNWGFLRKLF